MGKFGRGGEMRQILMILVLLFAASGIWGIIYYSTGSGEFNSISRRNTQRDGMGLQHNGNWLALHTYHIQKDHTITRATGCQNIGSLEQTPILPIPPTAVVVPEQWKSRIRERQQSPLVSSGVTSLSITQRLPKPLGMQPLLRMWMAISPSEAQITRNTA